MIDFNTYEEVEQYLVSLGFKKFNPPNFNYYKDAYACFQKRYDDEMGKKYFIDALVWDFTFTDKVPYNYIIGYEGQYYQKGTHNATNIKFNYWEIEQVEEWLDKLFDLDILEHYEKWDWWE